MQQSVMNWAMPVEAQYPRILGETEQEYAIRVGAELQQRLQELQ